MIRRLLAFFGVQCRDPRWSALRRLHLHGQPCCVVCGTRKRLAVHHILPVHLYPERELDPTNLLTMCAAHHLLVGHLGSFLAFNVHARTDAAFWADRIRNRKEGRTCS